MGRNAKPIKSSDVVSDSSEAVSDELVIEKHVVSSVDNVVENASDGINVVVSIVSYCRSN